METNGVLWIGNKTSDIITVLNGELVCNKLFIDTEWKNGWKIGNNCHNIVEIKKVIKNTFCLFFMYFANRLELLI